MAGFRPGQAVQCVSLAVTLEKEADRVGFKIGGGIDQDPGDCVFHYPDSGVYVTFVEPDSPAARAGLLQHDKILQVNGVDFTMVTHDRAVKCIKRSARLDILVARR